MTQGSPAWRANPGLNDGIPLGFLSITHSATLVKLFQAIANRLVVFTAMDHDGDNCITAIAKNHCSLQSRQNGVMSLMNLFAIPYTMRCSSTKCLLSNSPCCMERNDALRRHVPMISESLSTKCEDLPNHCHPPQLPLLVERSSRNHFAIAAANAICCSLVAMKIPLRCDTVTMTLRQEGFVQASIHQHLPKRAEY